MTPRTLILGTAGHIDHGKTALVRALTGVDTDRLPQEKERGITIDIGFAALDLGASRVGIVDVPGHERFIKNMLAGASGIDLAMLVVAADDSVMPQTREHLAILELLGIERGLVALTKTDLAAADWLDLVEEDITGLVRGTFLEGAPIVRTSAATGEGIDALRSALAEAAGAVEPEPEDAVFRLPVDRAFVQPGVGTVVTGSVQSGRLGVGDRVEWMPSGAEVRVRGLHSHDQAVEHVTRGQRAAVNLMGVHHASIRRGHEIATPGYLRPSRLLTARLRVLAESPWPIRHRARVRLYLGTQEVMAKVSLLSGTVVEPGAWASIQLTLAEPAVAVGGQPFVIRAESPLVTLGGGRILQPAARRLARRDAAAQDRLPALHAPDEAERAAAAIHFLGTRPWNTLDVARDAGLRADRAEAVIASLDAAGTLVEIQAPTGRGVRLHRAVLDDLEERALGAVARLHEEAPLETVIPRARLRQALRGVSDDAVFGALVGHLLATGRLTGDERGMALVAFAPKLTGAQRERLDAVIAAYRTGGFAPPSVADLAPQMRTPERELRSILELAVSSGGLVHLGGGFYLHRESEVELRRRIGERLARGPGLTVSQIREILGTSRKYALPMCTYLDRIGLTRRLGDERVLTTRGAEMVPEA